MEPETHGSEPAGNEPGPEEKDAPPEPSAAPPETTARRYEATVTRHWWLRLQITLGLAGGLIWFAGSVWDRDFVAGVGLGFLFSALILRLGRTAAADE